jgi:hypothetical protein
MNPPCHGASVPVLAFSALDALLGIGLAIAGFIIVALVCAVVLAALHVVLPSTDSGAAELDGLEPREEEEAQESEAGQLDTGRNA